MGIDIAGEAAGDISGYSVSLSSDGNVLAIGGIYNNGNGTSSGHVRVYSNNSGVWTQIGADIDGEAANDACGYSVSLSSDGNIVATGSYANDGNNGNFPNTGHVRVFDISPVLSSDGFVLSQFSIYPNPVSELVTISLQNDLELKLINIYNSLGQFIKSEKNSSIDVRQLSKGTYFFEVITNKGKATKAIIVK